MNTPLNSTINSTVNSTLTSRASVLKSPRRLALAIFGFIFVGLAIVGAILPGMPTTIFLILASYCFTRSCPWLEEKILKLKIFAPYAGFIDRNVKISKSTRIKAILCMWLCISISLSLMFFCRNCPLYAVYLVIALGLIGNYAILRFRAN